MSIELPLRRAVSLALVALLVVSAVGVHVATTPATAQTEEQEPNEDREDANPIEIGENVTGTINTGDTDWFVTENVTRGQTITVNFTNPNDPEANSHRFVFYDLNGSKVAGQRVDGNESIEVGDTVEDSGPYYIRVNDRQSGPYSFVVNVTGEGNPETAVEATEAETTAGGTTAGGTTVETMTDDATTEEPAPTTAGETTEVPTAEEGTTEPEPTDTAVRQTTDASETTGGSDDETTTEAAGGTGAFGPGFGPLLAVVALLAVALYAARRRT